jgi:hypothetical protein
LKINDLLWLPTEWEMFGENTYSIAGDETAANQARLEYYTGDESRIKLAGGSLSWYWEASANADSASSFCVVGNNGDPHSNSASGAGGCAPAFCVR